ncbi:MAG TPA: nucleotide exchange factor GrpE, partial [Caulobacteraceae bacterium]
MTKDDEADHKAPGNGGANGSEPEDADIADSASGEPAPLEAEVAALKDQALRYAAEVENTRRRAEREVNDARAYAIQKFA